MVSMAFEAGDAATWGSTVIALASIFLTLYQARSQKRDLKRDLERQNELQAEASQLQRRQIEASERRALAMEHMLERLSASLAPYPSGSHTPSAVQIPARWETAPHGDGAPDGGSVPEQPPAPDVEPDAASEPSPQDPAPGPGYGYPQPAVAGPGPEGSAPHAAPDISDEDDWTLPPPAPPAPAPAYPVPPSADGYGYPQQPATPPPPPSYQPAAPRGMSPYPASRARSPWFLRRSNRHTYALVNSSGATLWNVRVNPSNLPPTVRNLPEAAVVRPYESVEFLMADSVGAPVPREVWVSWEGQAQEVAVPVP